MSQSIMKKDDREFLFHLLETPSPTGFEMRGQQVWADWIKSHAAEVACDSYGSTWATLPGKSKRVIMLEAHADEIGEAGSVLDFRLYLKNLGLTPATDPGYGFRFNGDMF